MDLFDFSTDKKSLAPLADRMRPKNLSEFIGQSHLIYDNSLLVRAIKADKLGSAMAQLLGQAAELARGE